MPLDAVRTGGVFVLDHLLGLVGDGLVDLLKRIFSGEQVVFLQELPTLFGESVELPGVALSALVVVQGELLHDPLIDQLLDVLVDSGVTHAGVELLEFVHRRKLLGVLEDVVDQREPPLLGDEVDKFPWCRVLTVPKAIVHIRVFNRVRQSSLL